MVLADTSVWIDHLRRAETALVELLNEGAVAVHPFVLGEISCGNLRNRDLILKSLSALPSPTLATHAEVIRLVEERKLWGQGVGWVDVHLLASALLSGCVLWTRDARLNRTAALVGVGRFPAPFR
jgi:predicted nucleic acid-binding protein